MAFIDFQKLSREAAVEKLLHCCHSRVWAEKVADIRASAKTAAELYSQAEKIWSSLGTNDWLEAFAAHPKIGDPSSLRAKYSNAQQIASSEQIGVVGASEKVIEDLARLNQEYERKNGFIFIVFATGKTASEMLALLEARIANPRALELENAAAEQAKITRLRMEKLL